MYSNRLKQKLNSGEVAFGAAIQIDSPWLVEICGLAGFDYVLLDGEHGFATYHMPQLIVAANASGITPIVRVPNHDRGLILPALDAGAGGVHIPMVNDAAQAKALVREMKYAPLGERGFSLATRASRYGSLTRDEHVRRANEEALCIVTLETLEAIANAAEIARIPGIDLIFIGRDDLTESLGAADRGAPEVREAIRRTVEQAGGRAAVGTTAFSEEDAKLMIETGVRFLLTGTTRTIRQALEVSCTALQSGAVKAQRLG